MGGSDVRELYRGRNTEKLSSVNNPLMEKWRIEGIENLLLVLFYSAFSHLYLHFIPTRISDFQGCKRYEGGKRAQTERKEKCSENKISGECSPRETAVCPSRPPDGPGQAAD